MRHVRGFGRFWWDFVVGDDWRIAAGVLTVLAVGALLATVSAGATVVALATAAGIIAVALGTILAS
jgi:hypothetical protein